MYLMEEVHRLLISRFLISLCMLVLMNQDLESSMTFPMIVEIQKSLALNELY